MIRPSVALLIGALGAVALAIPLVGQGVTSLTLNDPLADAGLQLSTICRSDRLEVVAGQESRRESLVFCLKAPRTQRYRFIGLWRSPADNSVVSTAGSREGETAAVEAGECLCGSSSVPPESPVRLDLTYSALSWQGFSDLRRAYVTVQRTGSSSNPLQVLEVRHRP